MELTIKQVERLQYRKERLAERASRLEFLLSGRGTSLLPLVQTKTGKHSEKRTWALVEDLLAALEKYEVYLHCLKNGVEEDRPLTAADGHLPEQERTFYRSFLYCALRVMENDHPFWIWGREGTFKDLLGLTESAADYKEKLELHAEELYWGNSGEPTGGFFDCMDHLYEAITGRPITDTLSEEDRHAAEERVLTQKKEEEADWAAFLKDLDMTEEEYETASREINEQLGETLAEEPEREEQAPVQKGRNKVWSEAFPNKDMLCQQYLLCRELYFQADRRNLSDRLKNALDFYLYEHGQSSYLEDDTFFYTYALLNKVIKQIENLPKGEAPQ